MRSRPDAALARPAAPGRRGRDERPLTRDAVTRFDGIVPTITDRIGVTNMPDALADALGEGHVAAAAPYVYENEPAVHPRLVANRRPVVLPHPGTIEARTAMGMQAIDNREAFFAGVEPPNRVG